MAVSTEVVLASVQRFADSDDVASLAALENHPDREVKKAVRRALHKLRTRGIEIPRQGRSWAGALERDAGATESIAFFRAESPSHGAYMTLSLPDADEGSTLIEVVIEANDVVSACQVYYQTDGQRARMVKSLEQERGNRRVASEWVRARIRWGRERTVELGHQVPPALDEFLVRLGDPVSARPACFLREILGEPGAGERSVTLAEALLAGDVPSWSPLLATEHTIARWVAKMDVDPIPELDPEDTEARERAREASIASLREAARGDEAVRAGLRGPIANALEDAAVDLWQHEGEPAVIRRLLAHASELRASEAPEQLADGEQLLFYQVIKFAVEQQARALAQRQQQASEE